MSENGKFAVVTGASKGIGLAVVRALAEDGYRVAAGARTISAELKDLAALAVEVDLATPDGPGRLVDAALGEFDGIDLLVNNVGGSGPRPGGFLSATDEDWQQTFDLTLWSAVRATRAALPSIVARRGHVVNIGSVNSRLALPFLVDYSAAKAALANLGKALAEEFGSQGVRVNTIAPGPVRTSVWTEPGGTGEALARQAGLPFDGFVADIPAATNLSTGQMTEPDEVAALVLFLVSGKAPNISGSELVIDGGMLKQV
ncbi:SDR family oxidoreductase [Actinoallomurus sp. NBC_01490]|jgi:NAD(P)-dependent dehydrogenase (short-subunit alcohol dehydrogenase family)|uniref:SDR family NAD(P)-dependent oxidoreductase n=1 Tax=Actinoallomurus sp. NBC_01490 TaxID=2903557 RepID=UPI002E304AFE|nr:SDR family oxidoreductase [Actinoallomurus sp. NBC_01490]